MSELNKYDSVYACAKDDDDEFDVIFDREDDIVDYIIGLKEDGSSVLFEEDTDFIGAEPCPAATAEERSDDENKRDYEKDIDAPDSKDAPKDAEGTVETKVEDEPEVGKKEDNTYTDEKDVKVEEDPEYQKESTDLLDFLYSEETDLIGTEGNSAQTAAARSCDDCNPDYEKKIDAPDTVGAPKDAEGTVDTKFEDEPEVGKKEDQTYTDEKDVKVEEDPEYQKESVDVSFLYEEDDLIGDEANSEKTAEVRSDDENKRDYEKDIDAPDSKDVKDAEGTEEIDFEDEPEVGKKEDNTYTDEKDVKVEEDPEYQKEAAEEPENGEDVFFDYIEDTEDLNPVKTEGNDEEIDFEDEDDLDATESKNEADDPASASDDEVDEEEIDFEDDEDQDFEPTESENEVTQSAPDATAPPAEEEEKSFTAQIDAEDECGSGSGSGCVKEEDNPEVENGEVEKDPLESPDPDFSVPESCHKEATDVEDAADDSDEALEDEIIDTVDDDSKASVDLTFDDDDDEILNDLID